MEEIYLREDPSFLQGIEYLGDGKFIENAGLYGLSKTSLTRIDGSTIKVENEVSMENNLFGEGICTLANGNFIRLTWREGLVHLLDTNLLEVESFPLWKEVRQGWGITRDSDSNLLFVSDGSHIVTKVDADSL